MFLHNFVDLQRTRWEGPAALSPGRHTPEGPSFDIKDRMSHPVVHIAYEDAVAYCEWGRQPAPHRG